MSEMNSVFAFGVCVSVFWFESKFRRSFLLLRHCFQFSSVYILCYFLSKANNILPRFYLLSELKQERTNNNNSVFPFLLVYLLHVCVLELVVLSANRTCSRYFLKILIVYIVPKQHISACGRARFEGDKREQESNHLRN